MRATTSARLLLLAQGALLSTTWIAADALAQATGAVREACRADFRANCAGTPLSEALTCLRANAARLSPGCQAALKTLEGSGAARAPSAPSATPPSAAPPAPDVWPHAVTTDEGGTAVVYQPQVVSWPERKVLNARMALGITPAGATTPILGTIEVAFATTTDLSTRTIELTEPRLTSSRFPSVDTAQAARFEQGIRSALGRMGVKLVPLDTVVMSLRDQSDTPPDVAVKNDPPAIYVSARPASLVVFDGEPVLAPIAGTRLSYAVNTNWDVFFDDSAKAWYLRSGGGWLVAPKAMGPWGPAGVLPPDFAALPNDDNFRDVKADIPGRRFSAADAPIVYVSTVPAEIIVTSGPPSFQPIPGTSLQYVANSDAALFRSSSDGHIYYLVSGRWFSAPSLNGPWTFATATLPPDFSRIPANGPRGFVRVSVPGTPEAQEALIQSQIPQQATLDRNTAKLDVSYAGTPQFQPIPSTPLTYAVNTSFDVIKSGDVYYACWQGAWFTAPAPSGPWTLASLVPPVIYTIPPASPLYRVTYVRVYSATPAAVTFGYTAGYSMGYVSSGVVVYGTGWYYPPVILPGPVPIYYPYPYSFAGATYYNAATGVWARGGAIYGPYGGAAKGGSVYNASTGAWARGGAIYGPNGGAGAFSAYNPSTGGYAHGSAVWGPDGASANASWYNPRTGVSGSSQQNSNAYSRWGSSTVSGPNQTVHTQSQSGARGSAGSFTSSSGAKGAGVSGSDGNRAGAVKTSGGDVYAGADGNVYKKTSSGWEKYDNGSWNSVQKPASPNTANSLTAPRSATPQTTANTRAAPRATTPTAQAGAQAPGGLAHLDQDRNARAQGGERQQQFRRSGSGGGREAQGRGEGGGLRR